MLKLAVKEIAPQETTQVPKLLPMGEEAHFLVVLMGDRMPEVYRLEAYRNH
jgi:hypothetical protein